MQQDFSMKWFGISDNVVVKFWAELEQAKIRAEAQKRLFGEFAYAKRTNVKRP